MRVLVVNAGSSSLKVRVLGDDDALLGSQDLPALGDDESAAAARQALARLGATADTVGHRVVHGGRTYSGPVRIDSEILRTLRGLTDLAPLHQPKSLAGVDVAMAALPDLPHVACFDTAFHATMPPEASTYPIPAEWRERWAVQRFGFHGLSHAYVASRAAELTGRPAGELRVVSCHLGAGASLAAIRDGRSVDTTMGFTPLEGLMMATRSGSVDPGLVLWLQTHGGLTADEVTDGLEHRSGLIGVGGTDDMRAIVASAEVGEPRAALALQVYLHRLRSAIAAMAASMDGLDVLVFTGGVGEHAPLVRSRAGEGLGFLGVNIDPMANGSTDGPIDRDIGAAGGPVRSFVVEAREDLQIAREVRRVLAS